MRNSLDGHAQPELVTVILHVRQAHDLQLALCSRLETIADSLPDNVDAQACLHAASAVCSLIVNAHQTEEDLLFPMLEQRWNNLPGLAATIQRLKFEHLEDSCYAEEVYDALMSYGRGEALPEPNAYGYMLRGFFEGLRRHIAFEHEIILPLLELPSSQRPMRNT